MRTKELLLVLVVYAALFTNAYAYAGEQKRTASDNYKSMLVEGRVWKMMDCELSGWGNTIDTIYYSILIREKTVFAGKQCYKAFVIKDGQEERLASYLCEEDSVIYRYSEQVEGWIKVFDFTLKVGEHSIATIDTISVSGRFYRRAYYPDSFSDWGGEYVVEGIGSSFFGPNAVNELSYSTCGSYVLSVYDGDECVFTKDDFIKEAYHSENVESSESISDSFLTEGKVWTDRMKPSGSSGAWNGELYLYQESKLGEDVVFDGIHFREVLQRVYSYEFPQMYKDWGWYSNMYLAEEGGKVYVRLNNSGRTILAMDFTMKEGETKNWEFEGGRIVPIHVKAVKDTLMNNKVRKCLYVEVPGKPYYDDVWIEGIGSLRSGLTGWTYDPIDLTGGTPQLYECRLGDELLYKLPETRKPVYNLFVVEGKKWNCAHYIPYHDEVESRYSYYLKGDTVIGGQTCKKMYVEGLYGDTPEYYAAFYEVNGRVYEYPKGRDNSILMYDYVQKAGEKGTFFGKEQEVIRIDTLESQNHSFRVMFVYSGSEGIEGLSIIVGGLGGSIYNMFVPGGLGGANNFLLSCDQDGKKLYDYADISSFVLNEEFVQWFQKWLEEQGQANNPNPQPAWVRLHLNVSKVDPSSGVPSVPKAPPAAPVVMVYDNLLEFQGEHPAYTLSIVDNAGNTLFTTEVPESMIQVMLPFILEKDMEVNLVQGTWRIYGSLDPDHETVKVNGISNHPASPSTPVYDLQGRRIQGEPAQKGIYVRDGKKYVRQ
jgi:hypothetical protein